MLLMNEKKMDVPLKVTETEKGIYLVEFTPSQPGTYLLTAFYTGLPVPQSPLRLQVVPRVDASKIKVEGLDRSKNFIIYYYVDLGIMRETHSGSGSGSLFIVLRCPGWNPHIQENRFCVFVSLRLSQYTVLCNRHVKTISLSCAVLLDRNEWEWSVTKENVFITSRENADF